MEQHSERRIHKVYVTRNTEYHVRAGTCVAVRDRRTGDWLRAHLALRHAVRGTILFREAGGVVPSTSGPKVGESLFFHADGRDLVTSAITAVERPARDVVSKYVH